ncbi:hypothetical protein [Natrarchaeobaculum aegyptiacum]|uniref:hypothetical protein n=1 Tax=Natrarchaeobaculum aegyptiacum TaxID=745377 RepID=UPI0012601DE8|nr:hypothetical protein [Natrarchaeobaculum aegyptiacum]
MDRRTILQSITASIATGTGIGSVSAESPGRKSGDKTWRELRGIEHKRTLTIIKNDGDVKELVDKVADDGWEPMWGETVVYRTSLEIDGQEGTSDSTAVPFKHEEDLADEEMFLVWLGNSTINVDEGAALHHLEYDAGQLETFSDVKTNEGPSTNFERSTAYTISESGIEAEITDQDAESTDIPELSTASTGYCTVNVCETTSGDWDTACIARLALAATGSTLGCLGSAIKPSLIVACAISVGLTADQLAQCSGVYDGCQGGGVQEMTIEQEWLWNYASWAPGQHASANPCNRYAPGTGAYMPIHEDDIDDAPTR